MEIAPPKLSTSRAARALQIVARTYLTLGFPVLLLLGSARLVMSTTFLRVEYTRPGFPDDFYGFTTEDRLNYAPFAIEYLLNGEDITYLSSLRFPDGSSMYNVRELQHMRDVKAVTQIAFFATTIGGVVAILTAYTLGKNRDGRRDLRRGLLNGSTLTLGIIASVVVAAVINWDFFFTGFHTLFFASGTWRFAYSDTLIRLFPEQFWFDAALVIGGMTSLAALVILASIFRWKT